jgi:protein-tyrosine phosphatase
VGSVEPRVIDPDWGHGYGEAPSDELIAFWERVKLIVSEIVPKVYVSGFPDIAVRKQMRKLGIQRVISLTHKEPPELGIPVERFPFTDSVTKYDVTQVQKAVDRTIQAMQDGEILLVHCAYGLNRSPLVTALALHQFTNLSGPWVLNLIRSKRPGALHNPMYAEWLESL